MTHAPVSTNKFVLLRSIKYGNRFFTTHDPNDDPTLLGTGEVAYDILGYASTVEEAQISLYGRAYTT